MAASVSRRPLDRAVRFAVSDALASVKSHVYDLEYTQRRSPEELVAWNNYLAELRSLHQLLLNLPSLETAEWLTDDQADHAPTFTPFVHGINDAKTSIRRVHNWLLSLPQASFTEDSAFFLERNQYVHQVDQALNQLQRLPVAGSDAWYAKYQPAVETVETVVSTQRPQQLRVRAAVA
ncbi:hypothetical protein IQ260_14770 [Leptolyngbya cf. ectocarpi LEGE 11479]|uniref:Uncharacterized protein n=1 Tax=Leptolyngbya cf. ectocarpi LEGE 11479 TaxID=1828722 RepID=A0A929FA44_LEPEC|nr:hypothetical protein [Leptolyngbya ectocarpi]MBE9067914.1 hypothetical protein [Leptolyngbya cf. ectocarpi LEGE 11479]